MNRNADRFQKEWSDILGKTVWFKNDTIWPAKSAQADRPAKSNPTGGVPETQANIRKILRLKGTKKNKYYVHLIHIVKNIAYKSGFDDALFIDYLESIEWDSRITDEQIYAKLRSIHGTAAVSVAYHRADSVSQKLVAYLKKASAHPVERYMDYGCGTGDTIKAIGSGLGVEEKNMYGVDIVRYEQAPKNFGLIKNNKIPHPDDFVDLITASYVFHHIPDKDISECIEEIYRVLRPSGTLLIREHNVMPSESAEMTINLDVMHDIYSEVLATEYAAPWKSTALYYSKYRSSDEWDSLMKDAGFVLNEYQPMYNAIIKSNPMRAVVRLYNKPANQN